MPLRIKREQKSTVKEIEEKEKEKEKRLEGEVCTEADQIEIPAYNCIVAGGTLKRASLPTKTTECV